MPSNFTVNTEDLAYILQQIIISERETAGETLQDIIGPDASLLPYGLRKVDGSDNNLLPGGEQLGAADTVLPRLLDPVFGDDGDGDSIAFGPPGQPGPPPLTNTDYGSTGSVVDADPRTISNLIVDQSNANPAAVAAWHANPIAVANWEEAHPGETLSPTYIPTNEELSIIQNQSPDVGLSPSFNGWMTFFGQFFDHGLDLITKGGNGTVYIPLMPDDPLYVEGGPNFMPLTRSTQVVAPGADGVLGTADDLTHETINTTTSWIDQNQTYTSHASHQVFLREYAFSVDTTGDGVPDSNAVSTGNLLNGAHGGPANWGETKAQALEMLGIRLTDADVLDVPLLATDEYGKFIPGPNGYALIATPDGFVEGTAEGTLIPANAFRTGHAFLNDIAHTAAPVIVGGALQPDADVEAGNPVPVDPQGQNTQYDNELLDQHFITGDGRGNENIGLTAVHTIFHSEHNRLVEANKATILESGDLTFINQWLKDDITQIPTDTSTLVWDGERLFQAARFVTEMEYQHLVFEEFARKVQPNVDPFVFTNTADIDPSITAEFAHVVYRFGHSMLTDTVSRMDDDMNSTDISLFDAFLNPQAFVDSGVTADEAAGAIVRGMVRQAGNEIDEFVVEALRNQLVGLPLDLAALNIARGRETGVPAFNVARAQFFAETGDAQVKPYESWFDFTQNLKNPLSIVNFIAAYGTHESIAAETTIEGKRAAATALVLGTTEVVGGDTFAPPADRLEFLSHTGAWASTETGLNLVDFWIGGLAEQKMEFGGMLGSTFNFVFENQMENLQNGDRFYYLSRLQGTNLLNQLEPNTFAELVMRNTDLGQPGQAHLPGTLFDTPDLILELNQAVQIGADPTYDNPITQALTPKVVRHAPGADVDGDGHADGGYLKYFGPEHVVLGGTEGNDTLIGDKGIDALWGDGGNDYLNAGMESDQVFGGDGDDIIIDPFGDDFLRGEDGNDVISGGHGFDLLFGGRGNDFIVAGDDVTEVFAGEGNDFVLGGGDSDALLGNEGDDWIEGGEGFDALSGENSQLFFNSPIIGHDILNGQGNDTDYDGESGDDIMFQGAGIQRNNGMLGFDWAIHKGDPNAAHSDLGIPIFVTQPALILRDRFDSVEGLSGWKFDDVLTGTNAPIGGAGDGGGGIIDAPLTDSMLLQQGVDRIAGLQTYFGPRLVDPNGVVFNPQAGGDILLGGDGSDLITGQAGDDIIDGDRWLNVRVSVRNFTDHSQELFSVDSLSEIQARLLSGQINPGQLEMVRELIMADGSDDVDTAVFSGVASNYTFGGVGPNGGLRVTDDTGVEGTDTLWGIERLQFADQTITISGDNFAAFGTVTISNAAPSEHELLTATADVFDVDGIAPGTLSFIWQTQVTQGGETTWVDIPGAVGATFTPTADQIGLPLRAVATFLDLLGVTERVTSDATAAVINVNDPTTDIVLATAALAINENSADGLVVGSVLAIDADGPAGLVYSLSDDAGGRFAINDSGQITAAHRTLLDFEQNATHAITVRVTDGGATFDKSFTVAVGDVAPEIVSGDADDNVILAGLGNDRLDGLGGADTLAAGVGADNYWVDDLGDVVTEVAGEGADIVFASSSWTLGAGSSVETLRASYGASPIGITLTGNELANNMRGGGAADGLVGGGGDDRLDGLAGADVADGGLGSDVIFVDDAGDVVDELIGEGTDTVYASTSWTLGAGSSVETVRANYGASALGITLGGNELANSLLGGGANDTLVGGGGNDRLDGLAGADVADGGLGNDNYLVNDVGDVVNEGVGEGADTVYASQSWTLGAGSSVETLRTNYGASTTGITLTGNEVANSLIGGGAVDTFVGGGGNDSLDGKAGADVASGGTGDDIYYVDNAGDVVNEAGGEGSDILYASRSWVLGVGSSVETLRSNYGQSATGITLTGNELANNMRGGGAADTLVGDGGNDRLTGGSAADLLIGGSGNDTLFGGVGDDTLVFQSSGFGADRVADFDSGAAGAQDLLDISGLGITAVNFAAQVHISQSGASTLVEIGGDSIVLVGINVATIDQTDFALA
ncbi:peroxidase family protein [Methylopila capsulata]|nr:hypothetical protein GCM10008170_26220 [Methylopila capsulata]